MATKLAEAVGYGTPPPSWDRSLRAANKSPETMRSYGDSARLLEAFVRDNLGVTRRRDPARGRDRRRLP
jgi:hypothetical protein